MDSSRGSTAAQLGTGSATDPPDRRALRRRAVVRRRGCRRVDVRRRLARRRDDARRAAARARRGTHGDGARRALRGRLLGELDRRRPRHRGQSCLRHGEVDAADPDTVDALHRTTGADSRSASNLTAPGGPARLLPHRFNRHTFWCGQSGSGKTYALGVVLEQLIAHTALPIVDLRPELRLRAARRAEPRRERPDRRGARAARHPRAATERRPAPAAACPLHRHAARPRRRRCCSSIRWPIARSSTRCSICRRDAAGRRAPRGSAHACAASATPARSRLAHPAGESRAARLGGVGREHDRAVTDIIAERPDATVLDLGGFSTPEQQLVVALSVLDDLWARREERRPVLLVIDEAHNLASPEARFAGRRRGARADRSRSPPRAVNSVCGSCSRRNARRRCTPASSPSATTSP